MPHILVRQNVEDFAKWKELFDSDISFREPAGSKGAQVFQSADDAEEIFVLMEWDNMERLQQFAQSDELKARMKRAGATGPPDIYFVNLVDSLSA